MKNERIINILRVLIFTALAWGLMNLFLKLFPDLTMKNSLLFMSTPLFAHVITRLLTRDKTDTKGLFLHLEFENKLKYYIWTFLYPVVVSLVSSLLIIFRYADNYRLSEQLGNGRWKEFLIMIFFSLGHSVFMFYICLGEEYGWRAYLTPKLESLMPEPLALILSGCIWGIWHAPLIRDMGLNFGTGYKFFPYAGYIAMCVCCIFTGAFLTWLTRRTESIYPAAICHTIIDTLSIVNYLVPEKILEKSEKTGQFAFNFACLYMLGDILIGAVFFVILCLERRDKKDI
ncbi:MAG: CPBP family intramembrane metalloprotease [Ruminococcus sp.]|nr:CPBP family intramembrane metalloprotease [Ruminococcus sp.]